MSNIHKELEELRGFYICNYLVEYNKIKMPVKLHTTIRVYLGGTYKKNGVLPEDLEAHIGYNKQYRFGGRSPG